MLFVFAVLFLFPPAFAHAQETYFATYEGTGTDANPFRAHSNIRGTECLSLRVSEAQAIGIAWCKGPSLPARAGILKVDLAAVLTAPQKTALAVLLRRPITETTVGELLTSIIDANGIPLRRWKDGRQRLMLKGREIWSRPAPIASYLPSLRDVLMAPIRVADWLVTTPLAYAASYTEPFTATDGVLNGCQARGCSLSWTHWQGITLNILSNRVSRAESISLQLARASGSTMATDDMKVGVTLSTMTIGASTDILAGVLARKETGNNTSTNIFCTGAVHTTQDYIVFGHTVAGTRTDDGTVNATVSNGDVIELAVVNDVKQCAQNGVKVLGPFTDTTGSGFTEAGIRMSGSGTVTSTLTEVDNWYAQDITSLPGSRQPIAPLVTQ